MVSASKSIMIHLRIAVSFDLGAATSWDAALTLDERTVVEVRGKRKGGDEEEDRCREGEEASLEDLHPECRGS